MKIATLNVDTNRVEPFWTDEKLEIAKRLWDRGDKPADIARVFGVTNSVFYKMRSNYPDMFPDRKPVPSMNRMSEKHDEILAMHKQGADIKDIARELDVSESTLGSYMRMREAEFEPEKHAQKLAKQKRRREQIRRNGLGLCANTDCERQAVGKYCEPCAVEKYSKPSPARLYPNEDMMRRYG